MTDAAQSSNNSSIKRGFVKQVLSGDSVVLQGPATANEPPKEITVYLSSVNAPRLAKRPIKETDSSTDEPYAWESREFLRKKIVGKTVVFVRDFIATSGREHGRIYLGGTNINDSENISETGVAEGWLEVKPGKQADEFATKLLEIQQKAKVGKRGRWSDDEPKLHVRNICWNIDDPRVLVEKYKQKEIDAVVEQIRDGSTVRALLLPNFEYVTVMLSGVKAPSVRSGGPDGIGSGKSDEFGEQAKYFVETRLLQRDVKIVLENVGSNQSFVGSVVHPRGNIAEFLLREGYAKCVEWSIAQSTCGSMILREAERYAKERRLRIWRNYVSGPTVDKNAFTARVVDIGLGDSIVIKKENGEESKIYFSSFRPPRRDADVLLALTTGARQFRPLYDVPFMFEAREYLRKRLIGKIVTVTVDSIQAKSEQFPEKHFATVIYNNNNVAEGMLARGLGKVVRHKQDDDNRSSNYDALLVAESKAEKEKKGLWSDNASEATLRVQELQGDVQRSKQFLPYLQRSTRSDGVVEFVSSGSRLRIYIPKETCIVTFLLAGISCPRNARTGAGGKQIGENEPFAEEALQFTKTISLLRDVQIEVESMDKAGGFIGYLFVQDEKNNCSVNLSEKLVENGLATVHFTADRSSYFNALVSAEKRAKEACIGLWKDYVEQKDQEGEKQAQVNDVAERKVNLKKVLITEVYPGLRFAAQSFDDGPLIERLMNNLQVDLNACANPSSARRGQLAATKFQNLWHRVRVESLKGSKADIYYIDFGNRETVPANQLIALPAQFHVQAPGAKEYQLALVSLPNDADYAEDTKYSFERLCFSYPYLYVNAEYKAGNVEAVTLYASEPDKEKIDIGLLLVENGNALADQRREARFKSMVNDYLAAETNARQNRRNIWRYGDFTGNEI